jgi:serine/threonine-protein kinase
MSGSLPNQADLETILRPNQVVAGRYRVDRLMAEGGMAAVWAGVNVRTGKRVALKVILRSFAANGEAAELFRREALAASKVNHPNVVSIFDVIDHEGMTCIVMELLEGETLASFLARKGPLAVDEAVALLLPAMRGVAAANAIGVVHRDLKPGNIFLCSDTDGRVLAIKVLDFGISTMVNRAGERSTATDAMPMMGTPAYMAPEAIEYPSAVDSRADVYGLGILFFETLTGQVPFPGEPGTELLARIVHEPPPRVTEYRPDLPLEIAQIVDCALAKDAKDRFPDVDHFIHAIEDRLLPPLSVARSLSPIAGVSLLLLGESHSGPVVAKMHAVDNTAASGGARANETMALYSMAGESLRAADKSGPLWVRGQPLSAALGHAVFGFCCELWRLVHQRGAPRAAVAVFVAIITWLSIVGARRHGPVSTSPPTSTAHGPQVTPLFVTGSAAALLAPGTVSPSAPVAVREDMPADANVSSSSLSAARAALVPSSPLLRPGTPPQAKRGLYRETTLRRPRVPPARSSTFRAGRLLPSDF